MFKDLYQGWYFPAIALYMGAQVWRILARGVVHGQHHGVYHVELSSFHINISSSFIFISYEPNYLHICLISLQGDS